MSSRENADLDAHLRNLIGALAVAVTDLLEDDALAHGFTALEQAALIVVDTVAGMSQEDLRRRLALSQPGTSRLIDRLEGRGLMRRGIGADARSHSLFLTAAGEVQAQTARDRRHRLLARATSGLGHEERRHASGILESLVGSLVEAGSSPFRTCRLCDQRACQIGGATCPLDRVRRQRLSTAGGAAHAASR